MSDPETPADQGLRAPIGVYPHAVERLASLGMRAIVCTDMVGSTAIRSTIGEERADALRRDHDELIGAAVAAQRGRVLKWTGDGVQCEFATASAAVAAAIEMQRGARRYSQGPDAVAPFEIRIGVAVGEVSVDDDDAHGVPVIEAVRLEALAAPGETLATDLVDRLGRRRSEAAFEPIGDVNLKGLDGPVHVVRIVDTYEAAPLDALPKTLLIDRRFPLVGRDVTLAEVQSCWREVAAGAARTVLVSGPPGAGKSRLVSQLVERAHAEGGRVIAGACDSDFVVPYQPFAMALRDVEGDEDLLRALRSGEGPLGPLYAAHRRDAVDDLGASDRLDLFEAIADLLDRLAADRPLVLVLEDLHWSNEPTVQLLNFLLRREGAARLLVLATFRADEVDATHPMHRVLTAAHALRRVHAVALGPLSEDDIAQMVGSRVPASAVDARRRFARTIHAESAGSPFFVCELLHHLSSTGALAQLLTDGEIDHLPVPPSVRDVVAQRLANLPGASAEVLQHAAFIGLSFDLELLASVSARSLDETLDALEEACRIGVVQEVDAGRFSFSHAIVRSTLHDHLSATRRALGHRRVAERIELLARPSHEELAHHWAEAGDEGRAMVHVEAAGHSDLSALAYESAAERFDAVLAHLDRVGSTDPHARARACLGLGLAQRGLGNPGYLPPVEEAGVLARRLGDADLMADAALGSIWPGNLFLTAGRIETHLVELCEDALAALDASDPRRVRLLATLASHLTFDPDRDRCRAALDEAYRAARENGDPELIGTALVAEYIAFWDPSTAERRVAVALEIGRMARASGDNDLTFFAGFFLAVTDVEAGRLDEASGGLTALLDSVSATRTLYFRYLVERLLVSIAIYRAEPDLQIEIDALAARHDGTNADTGGTWALQTAGLALHQGTLATMADGMKAVIESSALGQRWMPAYGLARLDLGDRDTAHQVLDGWEIPIEDCFWLSSLQAAAELAVALGRRDWCARIVTLLEPHGHLLGVASHGTLVFGLVATSLGALHLTLGDAPAAEVLLRSSVERADLMGSPFEAVRSRRLLAEALSAQGDAHAEVGGLTKEALALADRHGFSQEQRSLLAGRVAT